MNNGLLSIIGLDGISWPLISRLNREGILKNYYKYVVRTGLKAINICIPPITPPSWNTIFTGVPPEKHGILGFSKFFKKDGNLLKGFYSSLDIKYPRLNEVLAINGLSGIVFNYPLSYPLKGWYLKNQVLIYDAFSPRRFIYPKSLENKYIRYFYYGEYHSFKEHYEALHRVIDGLLKIENNLQPDFLIAIFREPDNLLHMHPWIMTGGITNEWLIKIFELIDEFIKLVSRRYLYLSTVSDHGFHIFKKAIHLNRLLIECGLDPSTLYSEDLKTMMLNFISSNVSFYPYLRFLLISSKITRENYRRILKNIAKFLGIREAPTSHFKDTTKDYFMDQYDPGDSYYIFFTKRELRDRCYNQFKRYVRVCFKDVEKIDINGIYVLKPIPYGNYTFTFIKASKITKLIVNTFVHHHHQYGIFTLKGSQTPNKFHIINNIDISPLILYYLNYPLASYFNINLPIVQDALKNRDTKNYKTIWRIKRKIFWKHI